MNGSENLNREPSDPVDGRDLSANAWMLGFIEIDTKCSFCAPMLQYSASLSSGYRYVATKLV